MDSDSQRTGLDRFLSAIYGGKTTLPALLEGLGFQEQQFLLLCEQRLPAIASQFVEAVRRKLASGEKDLWFRLLSRRYGLDGEPPAPLDVAAGSLGIDPGYAARAEAQALQHCRYRTTLEVLRRELHRIALAELAAAGAVLPTEQVAGKLTRLSDLRAALDLTRLDYEAKRAEVLRTVQAELDALESEYQPLLDAAQENASALETEIKNDVLLAGESVSAGTYQAIYVKGRVSWDNEGMSRYARAHPDVLQYRSEGQPFVQLRTLRQD